MDELALSVWELPPDCEAPLVAPADANVEVQWRGQKTVAKVRVVKIAKGVWQLFFQPSDKLVSKYVVRYATSWPLKPADWQSRKTPQEASRIVKMATKNHQFCLARFFYLQEPQNAVAFFSDDECGWLDEREAITPFKMRSTSRLWSSPRLHDWLLTRWQQEGSEVRFAWQWSQWSEKQRRAWIYDGAGGINELVQIMKWALQSDPALQNSYVWSWYLGEASRTSDSSDLDRFRCEDIPYQHLDIGQISPRLWKLRQFFVAHFFPLPPLKIVRAPLCVRKFDQLHRSHIYARMEVQTSQEQAEAALQLRGWLRKNGAPAELLAL